MRIAPNVGLEDYGRLERELAGAKLAYLADPTPENAAAKRAASAALFEARNG